MNQKIESMFRFFMVVLFLQVVCILPVEGYNLRKINNMENLSGSTVLSLYQDKRGVMWIGTTRGLDQYNGKDVIEYSPGQDKNFFTGSRIDKMIASRDSLLWVQTYYGLYKINRETQSFESFDMFNRISFSGKDKNGTLFLVQGNNSIYYSLEDNSSFEQIFIPDLKDRDIIHFFIDDENHIWIFRKGGDNLCYSIYRNEYGDITLHSRQGYTHPVDILYCSNTACQSFSFIDANYCLYEFDITLRKPVLVCELGEFLTDKDPVTSLLKYHDDYFIGFKTSGLTVLRKEEQGYKPEQNVLSGEVTCLFRDKYQELVWIGLSGQGLYTYSVDQYSIRSVLLSDLSTKFHQPVKALFVDWDTTLWIGTKGDGILKVYDYERNKNIEDIHKQYVTATNSNLRDNVILSFSESRQGNIWIGSEEGITYFIHKGRQLFPVQLQYGGQSVKSVSGVYEQDSVLWISTLGMGILKATIFWQNDKPMLTVDQQILLREEDDFTNYFTGFYPENDTDLWCMNKGEGVLKVNIETGQYEVIRFEGNTVNETNAMGRDRLGNYLIGTNWGVIKYNSGEYHLLNDINGFPSNSIYSILADTHTEYWLSSNRGLIFYNTETELFRTYDHSDGLSVLEFIEGSACKDEKNGVLFFGGTNGFVTIHKNYYDEARHYMPSLFFTTLTIRDKQYPIEEFLFQKGGNVFLKLTHEQNFFSLSFSAIDHLHANNYSYYYKLEGINKEWVYNGNSNVISFSNLQPGKYRLFVKYYNKVWRKDSYVYRIDIKILPPWYKSGWAFFLYFFLLLLMGAVVVFLLVRRGQKKKAEGLQKLEQKHKEEIYEAKLQFFTNIAHEFCTPLTLIYGPCTRIIEQKNLSAPVLKYTDIIRQNAERLNTLIQDLVEFNRIESGYKKPTVLQMDVTKLVNGVIDSFAHVVESQKIRLEKNVQPFIQWNSDRDFLVTILTNLLSNAFKYTTNDRKVKVGVNVVDDKLCLTVSNTGKGIDEKDIPAIFDRYNILRNFESGDIASSWSRHGLGLAIAYNMVHLLEGVIEVESVPDEWTHFRILLPYLTPDMLEKERESLSLSRPDYAVKNISELSFVPSAFDKLKPTLLVVDDEADIRWLINDLFQSDFNVLVVSDVQEAKMILETISPDIIICDVVMEGIDGISFSRQLKADEKTAHIPFILLSAKQDVERQIDGLNAGAEIYITKPFHVDYLRSSVRSLLERKESLREYFSSPLSSYELENGKLSHKEHQKFVKQIIQIIHKNIQNKELSVRLIATKLNMGIRTFYRKLEEVEGVNVSDLIADNRLKTAVNLLTKTKLTIDEIVFKSGFTNRSSFYRAFSKKYGCTPSEYRHEHTIKK